MANSKVNKSSHKVNSRIILQSILAVALILGGFFLIFYSGRDRFVSNQRPVVSSQANDRVEVKKVEAKPYKLYIPKLHKILYISDGIIVNGRWMISDSGVSYLTTSALPGNRGNAVLYGHNLDNILGSLTQVADGDLVYVVMDSGNFYKYQIIERKEVKPNQVEILQNTTDSRVTIYTCSGFLDSARFVVVGKLVSSS